MGDGAEPVGKRAVVKGSSKDIRTYRNCFRPGGELVMAFYPPAHHDNLPSEIVGPKDRATVMTYYTPLCSTTNNDRGTIAVGNRSISRLRTQK